MLFRKTFCKKSWTTLQCFLFLNWHHFCLRKKANNSSGKYGSAFTVRFNFYHMRSKGSNDGSVCAEGLRYLILFHAPLRERFVVFSSRGSALDKDLSFFYETTFWKTFPFFICFANSLNLLVITL